MTPPVRQVFRGWIAGVGSSSGVRVVLGRWPVSPFGEFADAMVERADGHRVLLAPSQEVADFVAGTYRFDEVRVEPFEVSGGAASWSVTSPSLQLTVGFGDRMPLGRLLRLVPRALATSPAWARLVDPVARTLLRGVRTAGSAGGGRREYYGATDLRAVVAVEGAFDRVSLGALADVDPPCRFGFSSTPRRPSVATVTTTVEAT